MVKNLSIFEELNDKLRSSSIQELRQMITSSGMPSNVKQAAVRELEILSGISPDTKEYRDSLLYIGYLDSLPWDKKTGSAPDIARLEGVLNEQSHIPRNVRDGVIKYLSDKISSADKKPRILVVDDEKIARESLEYALTKEGYNVVMANNGSEAIEKLKADTFDLVITDLIMGDIDGNAVLEEAKKSCADTRLIMITGYASVDTAVQALRMGAFHYIEKPIKFDEVRSVVRDAFNPKAPAGRGVVLCLSGASEPENVSLGKIIAEATNRNFLNISLAGISDEAGIIGHGRTTGSPMPGRIIEEIRCAGSSDPVFMIEDFGSAEEDFNGNIESAILEAIDPRKNYSFTDRYLDLPFSLSNALFIITANNADNIHGHLRSLIEIIEF